VQAIHLGEEPVTRQQFDATWESLHDAEYPHHVIIQIDTRGAQPTMVDPTAMQLGFATGLQLRPD
jgi:hypothetical protein